MGEERSVAAARYASSDIQARWFAPRERARWSGGGGDGPMVDGLSPIAPFEGRPVQKRDRGVDGRSCITLLTDRRSVNIPPSRRRNLAVELLEKLLKGELATRRRKNVVQARSFAEMLEQTIRRYQNRAVEAAQVIEELIGLAREMREANARGEALGLSDDELAFYDALGVNDSAVQVLGDETLRDIARELVETVRGNVTVDWTLRENIRAKLRVLVKRILRKHGYPPDKQESATRTVLEQAEVLSTGWAT